jgi:integrase
MPARLKNTLIRCKFFTWKLYTVKGVYRADGRSNRIDLGRHSLGTRNREQAEKDLFLLDLKMAVDNGLAERSQLEDEGPSGLSLDQAFAIHVADRSKARVAGGVKPSSLKVYWKQWRKFLTFAGENRITHMGQINKELLNRYSGWLEARGTAPNYVAHLVRLIPQVINTLIETDHLGPERKIRLRMKKFEVEEAYAYTAEEFRAILNHCAKDRNPRVRQVGDLVRVLGYTGLRINELLSLPWHYIDLEKRFITVKDDSAKARPGADSQSTKSSRTRRVPIHPELLEWLKARSGKKSGLLFQNLDGGKLTYSSARETFCGVRKALTSRFPGTPGEKSFKDGCFHSLRHFFCSRHAQQGVPEMTMCKWLGHQSSRITRRYYHNNDQESLRLIEGVNVLGSAEKTGESPVTARDRKLVGRSKGRHGSGMKRRRKTG